MDSEFNIGLRERLTMVDGKMVSKMVLDISLTTVELEETVFGKMALEKLGLEL